MAGGVGSKEDVVHPVLGWSFLREKWLVLWVLDPTLL